jgi:hypothetical protein
MTSNSDDSETTLSNVDNPNDSVSTGSNLLLLRFFQSEWFTPAVSVSPMCVSDDSYVSRIWRDMSIILE